MKEKISVNEYVRTKGGIIDKVDALYGMIENTVHLENQKWFDIKNIVKHSKQLIDLTELGDFVNGLKVKAIYLEGATKYIKLDNAYKDGQGTRTYEDDIKTILTKEQMEANQYVVK